LVNVRQPEMGVVESSEGGWEWEGGGKRKLHADDARYNLSSKKREGDPKRRTKGRCHVTIRVEILQRGLAGVKRIIRSDFFPIKRRRGKKPPNRRKN